MKRAIDFFEIIFCHRGFPGNLLLRHCLKHPRYCWPLHFSILVAGPVTCLCAANNETLILAPFNSSDVQRFKKKKVKKTNISKYIFKAANNLLHRSKT